MLWEVDCPIAAQCIAALMTGLRVANGKANNI